MKEKNYDVVVGQDSYGKIELPFTYEMLRVGGTGFLALEDVNENELNVVEKEFRRRLYALSDEVVKEFLNEWFWERDDKEWLASLSREEELRWVAILMEDGLYHSLDLEEDWERECQPFVLAEWNREIAA